MVDAAGEGRHALPVAATEAGKTPAGWNRLMEQIDAQLVASGLERGKTVGH